MTLLVALISPDVPDAAVPIPKESNRTSLAVPIFCGVESVMVPLPFVTITWFAVPVSVLLDKVFPVVFPINNWPSVKVVCPVPPFDTGRVPVTFVAQEQ